MPRKNLVRSKKIPYHVTARSHDKGHFQLPLREVWKMVQESFSEAFSIHPIELISFVLMGNHYHMLLVTPDGNLDAFIYEFNKRLALKIKKQTGQSSRIFGGRYKWCLIESQRYLSNCYRYIYQNPLRARLVKKCEEYEFSTLYCILGKSSFPIPLHDRYGFKDEYALLWINEAIKDDDLRALKTKLNRSICSD